MTGTAKTRVGFGIYVALFASTLFVTHSTPAWVRWGLVIALLAPIATVLCRAMPKPEVSR